MKDYLTASNKADNVHDVLEPHHTPALGGRHLLTQLLSFTRVLLSPNKELK